MPTARRFEGVNFVWLQSPPWQGVWTRQNHFARRLARDGARILYVENPLALRTRLKEGLWKSPPVEVEPGITAMSLPLQIPGSRQSMAIGAINGRRFAEAVRAETFQMGLDRPIVWCRIPASVHALEHLEARAVVYDVTDDYDYYALSSRERHLTQQREVRIARRADQVYTTTAQLHDKLAKMTLSPVKQVGNGVDSAFFDRPTRPDPLEDIPHPRIGFVGIVAEWMDFDLLARLASTWPGQVVVVGPVKPEVESRFAAIPKLVRVGAVPHLEVPDYLWAFDVCILPHKINELRHRSDPLKIVEYLATGRPVVSVALRSLEELRPMVDLARTSDEFIDLVRARLADRRDDLAEARRALAGTRNWDKLYESVAESLSSIIMRT